MTVYAYIYGHIHKKRKENLYSLLFLVTYLEEMLNEKVKILIKQKTTTAATKN